MLETVVKRDTDLGTPEVTSDKLITVTIDGYDISVPEGTSVMRGCAQRRQHSQTVRHRQH